MKYWWELIWEDIKMEFKRWRVRRNKIETREDG